MYLFKPLNNRNEENLHHLAGSFLSLYHLNKEIKSDKIPFLLRDQIPLVYLIETLQPLTYNIPENFKGKNIIHGKTSWILDSGSRLYY
ncbi:hypothetical protein EH11_00133 [Bacillus subtilis]|nr:hypothetical protein EH11_00133 [Bacillus subtilis]RUS09401.1 hypothetical protein EFW59_00132 [Bacillus subtilis]